VVGCVESGCLESSGRVIFGLDGVTSVEEDLGLP